MPELPEVEISARRLGAALQGAEVESALAPGINALKTYERRSSSATVARRLMPDDTRASCGASDE